MERNWLRVLLTLLEPPVLGIAVLSVFHQLGGSEASPRLSFTCMTGVLVVGIALFATIDFKDTVVQGICFVAYLASMSAFLVSAWVLFDCLLANDCI